MNGYHTNYKNVHDTAQVSTWFEACFCTCLPFLFHGCIQNHKLRDWLITQALYWWVRSDVQPQVLGVFGSYQAVTSCLLLSRILQRMPMFYVHIYGEIFYRPLRGLVSFLFLVYLSAMK